MQPAVEAPSNNFNEPELTDPSPGEEKASWTTARISADLLRDQVHHFAAFGAYLCHRVQGGVFRDGFQSLGGRSGVSGVFGRLGIVWHEVGCWLSEGAQKERWVWVCFPEQSTL